MNPVQILVTGCKGRMGRAVIEAAGAESAVSVAAAIDIGDSLSDGLRLADTVIDFSTHTFTAELVDACVQGHKRLVMGTTGHDAAGIERIRSASQHIPIVLAPNFSVGVNTLFWLTRKAAETLGPAFDLEVVEMHHRHKADAPSGTARRLAEILAETRHLSYESDCRHGRHGILGPRTPREIGVHSLRGGDVVGDHTVIFAADGERVELTHKASSRQILARGAVRAAVWLASQAPGFYDMQDVLNLRT